MKLLSIIGEYNPFHLGHYYHLNQAKEKTKATHTISIISGDFTQRGELALLDKYERAKIALKAGINLVLELPFCYCSASAEIFAKGSVSILNSLNSVDYLSFGIEGDNFPLLEEIAEVLKEETTEYKRILSFNLDSGNSYFVSRKKALEETLNESLPILDTSNNILALEYLKALKQLESPIKPIFIKRRGALYNQASLKEGYPSATGLRKLILEGNNEAFLNNSPSFLKEDYKRLLKERLITLEDLFPIIKAIILTKTIAELSVVPDMEKGLENRLKENILTANSLEELIEKTHSKRITKNRIRRILLYILTNFTAELRKLSKSYSLNYIRVLAFDEKGQEILKEIKENSNVNIFTNYSKKVNLLPPLDKKIITFDINASNLYDYFKENELNRDYTKQIYK